MAVRNQNRYGLAWRLAACLGIGLFPGLWSAAVVAAEVTVSSGDCRALVRHQPSPGVEYEPGRDVRGRAVAPADGGGVRIDLPETVTLSIGIDLAEKYGLGAGGRYSGEGTLGTVTVTDGRAAFNGQPLDPADERALAAACRSRTEGR